MAAGRQAYRRKWGKSAEWLSERVGFNCFKQGEELRSQGAGYNVILFVC